MRCPNNKKQNGFIAIISVVVLASGCIVLSAVAIYAINAYADSVYLHELRIEVRRNIRSCLYDATVMLSRDYFLRDQVDLPEHGCAALFAGAGTSGSYNLVQISASAKLGPVVIRGEESVRLEDYGVVIISRKIDD